MAILLIEEPKSEFTADRVNEILLEWNSPAINTGEHWIASAEKWNVPVEWGLAFFAMESSMGSNPNWYKEGHNVGNIRCITSICHNGFSIYSTWQDGIDAYFRLIREEYLDLRNHASISDIVPVYAPAIENNVGDYINTVEGLINQWKQSSH